MFLLDIDSQGIGIQASVNGSVLVVVFVDLYMPSDLKNYILQVGSIIHLDGFNG